MVSPFRPAKTSKIYTWMISQAGWSAKQT